MIGIYIAQGTQAEPAHSAPNAFDSRSCCGFSHQTRSCHNSAYGEHTMSNPTTIYLASLRFDRHALNHECQLVQVQTAEPTFVENAPDLWAELDAIAATVPSEAWDALPKDYSARADEYIYRSGTGGAAV
jgi:hypothetical protein